MTVEIKELRAERGQLETRAAEIVNSADPETGLSAESQAELDKIHTRSMALRSQIDAHEKLAEIRSANDQVRDDFPPTSVRSFDREEKITDETRALAFQGYLRRECRMELEKRHEDAMKAVKFSMDRGEFILNSLQSHDLRRAQHQFLHTRALDLTTAEPVVPSGFVNRLESVMLTYGPLLRHAEIMRTPNGNPMKWPIEDDTAEEAVIVDEMGSTAAEAQPTVTKINLGAYKYFAKRIPVSSELLRDSPINLVEYLAATIGRRLGRGMNRDFTVGDGVDKPNGIVTAAQVGHTTIAGQVATLIAEDIIRMTHSIDEAHRSNARWMMNDLITLAIRLLKDDSGNFLWRPGIEEGQADRLAGYPVVTNGHMASALAASAKVAVFGDLSKYKARQVRGVRLKREYVLDTDSEIFTGFQEADGDLINPAAVKTLVMAAA